MATGLGQSRVASATVTGAAPTVTLTPTAGSRIVAVHAGYLAPEVSLKGLISDATGDSVVVTFNVLGPTTAIAYPVKLTVFEVTDA